MAMSVDLPYKYQTSGSQSPLCDLIVIYTSGWPPHQTTRPIPFPIPFPSLPFFCRSVVNKGDPFWVAARGGGNGWRVANCSRPEQRKPPGGSVQP